MKNRLQFIHCEQIFSTNTEAISYVESLHTIDRPSLYAEPMILKYGDIENPNIILAIGSVGDGTPNITNKTFFIDFANLALSIDNINNELSTNDDNVKHIIDVLSNIIKSIGVSDNGDNISFDGEIISNSQTILDALNTLSNYIINLENRYKLTVNNTKTIKLTIDESDNGVVLESNAIIANNMVIGNKSYDNNIITTDNGLFSSIVVSYDELSKKLYFDVNGEIKDFQLDKNVNLSSGVYSKESETLDLKLSDNSVIKIPMRDLINELSIDTFKKTPVILSLVENGSNGKDILSADISISSDEHAPFNILKKDEGGTSLRVDGIASNIMYLNGGDGADTSNYISVQEAIDNIDTNVSNDSSNIIYRKLDGIYANVQLSYNASNNTLRFESSNQEPKEIKLNSVSFLDDITYDSENESIIIRYTDANQTLQKIIIPISGLLEEWVVNNAEHTVTLTKNRNSENDKDVLTADVNVYNANDNILQIITYTDGLNNKNSSLYVKGSSDNIKHNNTTVYSELNTLNNSIKTTNDSITLINNDLSQKIKQVEDDLTLHEETSDTTYVKYSDISDGLNVNNDNLSVKLSINTESAQYLKFDENRAIELNGVDNAIDVAKNIAIETSITYTDNSIEKAVDSIKKYSDDNKDELNTKITSINNSVNNLESEVKNIQRIDVDNTNTTITLNKKNINGVDLLYGDVNILNDKDNLLKINEDNRLYVNVSSNDIVIGSGDTLEETVISINQRIDNLESNSGDQINYTFSNGLDNVDNVISVKVSESTTDNKNFLTLESETNSLSVRSVDTNKTVLQKPIIVAGLDGVLGTGEYKNGDIIETGTDIYTILQNILCKEIYPVTSSKQGTINASINQPSITTNLEQTTVEVGTSVILNEITIPQSQVETTNSIVSGFEYGSSTTNNNTKEFDNFAIEESWVTNITDGDTPNITCELNGFNANNNVTIPTMINNVLPSTTIGCVEEGSNTITVFVEGTTFTGSVNEIPSYYILSNLSNTDVNKVSEKVDAIQNQTSNKPTNNNKMVINGVYKYFVGYSTKTTANEFDSDSIRALNAKVGNIVKDSTTTILSGTPYKSNGTSIVIACPSKYKLATVQNGVGANIIGNFSSISTVSVKTGEINTDYIVYVYPITNGATVEYKNMTLTKA